MTTFNYSGQLPSVVDGMLVKRRLRANEIKDDEDRTTPREFFTALKDQHGGRTTAEKIVKHHLSSTAEATGDQELKIQAAKDLIAGAHYPSMVETFRSTFGMKGYEKHLFSSLCKVFGDKVMPKVLFHLKQEDRVSSSMLSKLWDSQFKY
ncbi:hypothetical protein PsorP6_002964 [Peronosclerospora sorghi]|uniref:Uncharacterized protein n=1 Tax=Peronosclerospora sorghi TaxID=230839 RepID=A0ACC0VNA1_9STRA|nr:hypothetical protein PsorP6_002964 [Peronosclerospora sorghi]